MTSPVRAPRRRVVVTGMGAVTPLGNDVATFWSRLVAGESGVATISVNLDPERVTSKIAGEVKDFDPSNVLDRKEIRRNDRYTQFALVATREAMDQAGLPEQLEGDLAERTGTIIGSGLGGSGTLIEQITINATRGPDRLSPFFIPMAIANLASGPDRDQLRRPRPELGHRQRLCHGRPRHRRGVRDDHPRRRRRDGRRRLGGVRSTRRWSAPLPRCAPCRRATTIRRARAGRSMRAATGSSSPRAPACSCSKSSTTPAGAAPRSSPSCAATARPPTRTTSPCPRRAARAESAPPARPGQGRHGRPEEIDLVSAHATSTPEGDPAELEAFKTIFGDHAPKVSITATKGAIGHTLGAAGGIGAIAAINAMREGCVPPTLNLVDPSPAVGDLDCTPVKPRSREVRAALVNAFGFGGQNAALVLRRWDEA